MNVLEDLEQATFAPASATKEYSHPGRRIMSGASA
jgi:hypothetical protein